MIAAANEARDLLAWQIGRVVLGDARTFAELSGVQQRDPGAAERSEDAKNLHAFRLMKRALRRRFGEADT